MSLYAKLCIFCGVRASPCHGAGNLKLYKFCLYSEGAMFKSQSATDYADWEFRDFIKFLQANTRINLEILQDHFLPNPSISPNVIILSYYAMPYDRRSWYIVIRYLMPHPANINMSVPSETAGTQPASQLRGGGGGGGGFIFLHCERGRVIIRNVNIRGWKQPNSY